MSKAKEIKTNSAKFSVEDIMKAREKLNMGMVHTVDFDGEVFRSTNTRWNGTVVKDDSSQD